MDDATGTPPRVVVRPVEERDLPAVAALVREHAGFDATPDEPLAPVPDDLAERLRPFLFGAAPVQWCLVVEVEGHVVGYASYTWQSTTWFADTYVWMDSLFVRDGHRGQQLGRRLFDAGVAEARTRGAPRLQWQTPLWNEAAQRFYDRTGARPTSKRRYALPLAPGSGWPPPVAGPCAT